MQLNNNYNTKTSYNPALLRPIPLLVEITPEQHICIVHNIYTDKDIKRGNTYNVAITQGEPGSWNQTWYTLKEALKIANNLIGAENTYFSMNPFGKPTRDTENIAILSSLYIDIDCESAGMSADFALDKVFLKVNKGEFPMPNLITHSGHGLHLVFLINPIPVRKNPKVISLWKYGAEGLANLLKDDGINVDYPASTDPSRVLRLAGTINRKFSKSKKAVKTDFYHSEVYDLRKIIAYGWQVPATYEGYAHTTEGRKPTLQAKKNMSEKPEIPAFYHSNSASFEKLNGNADFQNGQVDATGKNTKKRKKVQQIDFYGSQQNNILKPNTEVGFRNNPEDIILHNYSYQPYQWKLLKTFKGKAICYFLVFLGIIYYNIIEF